MPPCAVVVPTPFPGANFSTPENLDLADAVVSEIFNLMFGYDIQIVENHSAAAEPEPDERTAIVGFSGAMRGSCQIRMAVPAVLSIAIAMLGGSPTDCDDDSLNDALGELCNMLAGGWKNGVSGLASACSLSPPTVISGGDYRVHLSKPSKTFSRTYKFGGHLFELTMCREESSLPQTNR